jgi:hypothetical protein
METNARQSEDWMTDTGLQKIAFFMLIALIIYVGGSGGA